MSMPLKWVDCHGCAGKGFHHDDYQGATTCPQCGGVGRALVPDLEGPVATETPAGARIRELEAALETMTSNRIHDLLCTHVEDWENPHADYRRAKALLEQKWSLS